VAFLFSLISAGCGLAGTVVGIQQAVVAARGGGSGNHAPVASVDSPARLYDTPATLHYSLIDGESESISVAVTYSADGGETFLPAVIAGSDEGIVEGHRIEGLTASPGGKRHSFQWDFPADLGPGAHPDVRIRITPEDGRVPGAAVTTAPFVAGNDPPAVSVETPAGEQSGNVVIRFVAADSTSDPVDLSIEYTVDGTSFHPARLAAGDTTGVVTSPAGTPHTVVWDSAGDLPSMNSSAVRVRMAARDTDAGPPDLTAPFPIKNNLAPTIFPIKPSPPLNSHIGVSYELVDPEGDLCALLVEYSIDGGKTYLLATEGATQLSHGTIGLVSSPTGVVHTFVWHSIADLGEQNYDTVSLRFTPSDENAGAPKELTFKLENGLLIEKIWGGAIGNGLKSAVPGDLNGDGRMDFAAIGDSTYDIRIFIGNAQGGYDQQKIIPLPAFPSPKVAVGDLNGDKRDDIACLLMEPNDKLAVAYQSPDGTFGDATCIPAPYHPYKSIEIGDFTGDGLNDVAFLGHLTWPYGYLYIYKQNPATHNLEYHQELLAGDDCTGHMGVGDINGDGKADIAVPSFSSKWVRLFLQSNGQLAHFTDLVVGKWIDTQVAIGDVDNNGLADVLCTLRYDNQIAVFSQDASGVFSGPRFYEAGSAPFGVAIAKVDGDDRNDVVVSASGENTLSIFRQTPAGLLAARERYPCSGGPFLLEKGSVEGNGAPLIFCTVRGEDVVEIFKPFRGVRLNHPVFFNATGCPQHGSIEDIDGDGYADILVPGWLDQSLQLYYQGHDGCFDRSQRYRSDEGLPIDCVAAGDLNDNGLTDVAYCLNTSFGGSVCIRYQAAGGGFGPEISYAIGMSPRDMVITDLNVDSDSLDDIVVLATNSRQIHILYQIEGGGFRSTTIEMNTAEAPDRFAVGDINGDGRPDIVVANQTSIRLYRQQGDESFLPEDLAAGTGAFHVAIGDINGDGLNDVIASDRAQNEIWVYRQTAGHAIAFSESYAVGNGPQPVIVGDFNGDSLLDLAVGYLRSNSIGILLQNPSTHALQPMLSLAAQNEVLDLAYRDVNNDGLKDLLLFSRASNQVGIFRGR
jgi:hypothetical protein